MSDAIRNLVPHVKIDREALQALDANQDGKVERHELDRGLGEDRVAFNSLTRQVETRSENPGFLEKLYKPKLPMDVADGKPLRLLTHNLWAKPAPIRTEYVPVEGKLQECAAAIAFGHFNRDEVCADTTARMRREAAEVTRMGVHVVTAQEAFSDDVWPLKAQFPFSVEIKGSREGYVAQNPQEAMLMVASGIKLTGSGLAVYSKFPILDAKFVPFIPASGTDALANKGVLFTRLYVPGVGPMDVYTTHMQDGRDQDEVDIRTKQLETVRNLVKQHEKDGLPTLITGDFNFTPDMNEYRTATQDWGWRDLYHEKNPGAPGITASPKNPHNSPSESAGRVDYIFALGPEITADQAKVVLDKPVDGVVPSDHYGVMADLQVKGE